MNRLRARLTRGLDVRGRATVGKGVRIAVRPGARVILEDGAALGDGCRIEANGGTVHVGARARIGERTVILAHAGVEIGPDATIGPWVLLADSGPGFDDPERPIRAQALKSRPITIGRRATVGVHAAVQADVPAGATVTPYAVLTGPQSSE